MTLFFDTETTGKANFNLPISDPSQPRLVQVAAILHDGVAEVASISAIIKPDWFTIPESASAIHGITTALASTRGVSERCVLEFFDNCLAVANRVVAHNLAFDRFVICRGSPIRWSVFEQMSCYCTMHNMTPHCKLPGKYGDYKWPKLSEAYLHCTQKELVGAHDALADVRGCMEVYWWLQRQQANESPFTSATVDEPSKPETAEPKTDQPK